MAKSFDAKFLNVGTNWQHFERKEFSPVNLYAATKQAFEDLMQHYIESEGLEVIQLDLCDTYGPEDKRNKLLPKLIEHQKNLAPLLLTNGDQLIDLVHISDVIDAFSIIVNDWDSHLRVGKFSLTSNALISIRELVSIIDSFSKHKIDTRWGEITIAGRKMYSSMAYHPSPIGWQVKKKIQVGITELIDTQIQGKY